MTNHAGGGVMERTPVLAGRSGIVAHTPALIEDPPELDGCSTCGNDLDEDAHGDQCLACWIEDKGAECADAEYDMEVGEVA